MKINHALLDKLCALAYLNLKDAERNSLLKSLNHLVQDFSSIQEVESLPDDKD